MIDQRQAWRLATWDAVTVRQSQHLVVVKTELRFSIQTASTGPSSTIKVFSPFLLLSVRRGAR